ncbi:MAG: hypothetical protein E7404_04695 [Ruminococcaceae bacterium]|nr:hypothetical protein [Oscillospiraceae bacterium]
MFGTNLKKIIALAAVFMFAFQGTFAATLNQSTIEDIMDKTQSSEPYSKVQEKKNVALDSQSVEISYPDGVLKQVYNGEFFECKESNGWGYSLDFTEGGPVNDKVGRLSMDTDGYRGFYLKFDSNFYINEQMKKNGAVELYIKTNIKFNNIRVMLTTNQNGNFVTNESSIMSVVDLGDVATDWQKIVLPISSWPQEASYWNATYGENQFVPFDFTNVNGIGLALSVPQLEEGQIAECYFDDWCITKGNVEDEMLGVTLLDEERYAKTNQSFNMLDLKSVANMGYKDEVANDEKGGWTDQGPTNDFSSFDMFGVNKVKGIPFNFINPDENDGKAVLVMRGQNRAWLPNRVEIPVNAFCAGAYFVHAAAWNSVTAATYKFVYEDNTEEAVPIIFKKHIANWWGASDLELMRTAWQGTNPSCGTISSYLFAFGNPNPDKKVAKLVLETPGDASIVCIQAITLTDKGPYLPNLDDRGNPDTSDWYAYTMPEFDKMAGTPLDASYVLDAPAGKHGFLTSKDGKLVFEDGKTLEIWGTNVVGPANFLDKSDADKLVASLKTSGVNVVRMHHLDSGYYSPNIFGSDPASMELDQNQMDKFCYFWAKLKEAGIYFMPGLLCGRYARSEHGIVDANNLDAGWKIECMFDKHLIDLQKKYAKDLFTCVNPYTGTSLATEPAAIMLEVHNECNITDYGGQYSFTSDYYRQEFYDLFNEWLKEKYTTNENLANSWQESGKLLFLEGENLDSNTITLPEEYKTMNFSDKRKKDSFEFLVHIAQSYHTEMINYLKNDIGVKTSITGVNNIIMHDLADLWENAQYDHVDRHIYWTHPSGYTISSGSAAGGLNSQVSSPSSSIFGYMSSQNVLNKPLVVSEWNIGELNPNMAENDVLGAAMFGYQGWHSTVFAYLSGPLPYLNKITGFFDVMSEPLRLGFMPASAVIRKNVARAQKGYYTEYSNEKVFDPINQSVVVPKNLFIAGECGVSFPEIIDAKYDNDESLIERAKEPIVVSDTEEILWDAKNTIFRLNSPKAQAIAGHPKGAKVDLNDVRFEIENEIATLSVTPNDDKPISESERMLLSVGARVRNSGMKMSPDGRTVVVGGSEPIILEPVIGKVTLKTNGIYEVYVLSTSGKRLKKLYTSIDENGFSVIELTKNDKTMHYEIVRVGNSKEAIKETMFKDVYSDNELKSDIEELCKNDIMIPYTSTLFMPDAYITTGDFIGALVRKLGLNGEKGEQFLDVGEYNRNYDEIILARGKGIILGDGENVNPYGLLTYEKLKIFLERAGVLVDIPENEGYVTREKIAKILSKL